MKRFSLLAWCAAGLGSGILGWSLGRIFGSFLPQTVITVLLIAVVLGLLAGVSLTAVLAGLAAAGASAAAFVVGSYLVTPLLAWPAAALAIGYSASIVMTRRRARTIAVLVTPLLGSLGFVAGAAGVALAGFTFDDSRVLSEFMWGGAAGFGLMTLGGLRLTSGWLDRVPAKASEETR
jgi:hypothetical protein